MSWVDIADGESGASVRTKLNTLGASNDNKAPKASPLFTGEIGFGANQAGFLANFAGQVRIAGGPLTFDTASSAASRGQIFIGAGGGGFTADEFYFRAGNTGFHFMGGAAGTAEYLTILVNGNVGIGDANPGSGFSVKNGCVNKAPYTVATLPGSPVTGDEARVTNALNPVFGSAVVGGGAQNVPVFYNGSAWIVG